MIDIQTSERNGPVVAVAKVTDADEVMLTTSGGMVIRTTVSTIRTIGRNTQGVRLIKLDEGDAVSSLAKLPEEELAEGAEIEPTAPDGHLPSERLEDEAEPVGELPDHHQPRIIDDGVGEADASDHIDRNGESD